MPMLTYGAQYATENYACNIYLFFSINSFNVRFSQRSAPRSVYALCCSGVRRTRIMMVGGAGAFSPFAFSASHAAVAPYWRPVSFR